MADTAVLTSEAAEEERLMLDAIEKWLESKVFLELHVKIRENWRDNEDWLKRFGYGK